MNKKNDNIRQRKRELKDIKKDAAAVVKSGKKNKRKVSTSNATKPTLHRIWTRTVVIFCLMVVVYFFASKGKEKKFASMHERNLIRFQNLTCSPAYLHDVANFSKCAPSFCGRFVNDKLIHSQEIEVLLNMAKNAIALGGSAGGASILDLHSGALSKGKGFVNIYNMSQAKDLLKEEQFTVFKGVKSKIRKALAEQFRIDEESLHLTYPSFFSRITNSTAKTIHDEYWHPHIDKETYEAFHFTSLLYLTDFGKHFTGGRFFFMDDKVNMTIEPVQGRVSGFTSGAENVHFVEKVSSGVRYALTVAFTCNPKHSIADPMLEAHNENSKDGVEIDSSSKESNT